MFRPAAALLACAVCCALAAAPSRAATKLEGEYQLMAELRKTDRTYRWDWDSNNGDNGTFNNAQFRIFSAPRGGIEVFTKFEADWRVGDNGEPRPEFQYREAHLRFRKEVSPTRGLDSYWFSRQDRFFVNTYLIPFVYGRGDAQGIRLDTWGFAGLNTTWIVGDQSSQFNPANYQDPTRFTPGQRDTAIRNAMLRTDDFYIVRLRREFLAEKKLRLGLTINRFEGWTGRDSTSGPQQWKSVVGFDSRLRVAGADVAFEYGESRPTLESGNGRAPELTVFKRSLGFRLPDRAVAQAEVRSIKLGTRRLGYLNVTPGWWSRGPGYTNAVGGPSTDETGFNLQSFYLLPERAITYTNNLLWYGNKVNSRNSTREIYNELYVEFVNGFTGKSAYRRRDTYAPSGGQLRRTTRLDWFNEVQVESRLAWLRVQSKLQDIGRPEHKQLFVIENSINLTQKTKVYSRFALGNDASILRKAIFTQLQYRPTGNMEMFLQYGPDYIGSGGSPVDEGNLAGSGDQFDVVKFILKGNF